MNTTQMCVDQHTVALGNIARRLSFGASNNVPLHKYLDALEEWDQQEWNLLDADMQETPIELEQERAEFLKNTDEFLRLLALETTLDCVKTGKQLPENQAQAQDLARKLHNIQQLLMDREQENAQLIEKMHALIQEVADGWPAFENKKRKFLKDVQTASGMMNKSHATKEKDEHLEHVESWYSQVNGIMEGIGSTQVLAVGENYLRFLVCPPSADKDECRAEVLVEFVDSTRLKSATVQLTGVEDDCMDIAQHAVRTNDIAFLIREVQARLLGL